MLEDDLTLDQALAWVVWRDWRLIDSQDMKFIELDLQFGSLAGGNPVHGFPKKGDKVDLLKALAAGKITARGCKNDDGTRISIPPKKWKDLKFYSGLDPHRIPFSKAVSDNEKGSYWTDIRLIKKDVFKRFPAKPIAIKNSEADQKVLDAVVATLVREFEENGHTLNGKSLYRHVNARLPQGKVGMAWAEAKIKELPFTVRNKRGRPPKIFHNKSRA